MADPILYRKRLIPEECVLLKDDRLLYRDEEIIVTAWNTLKPRKDLHHGLSCYYLQEGIKVSRFYDENGSLLYWYCDIRKIAAPRLPFAHPGLSPRYSAVPIRKIAAPRLPFAHPGLSPYECRGKCPSESKLSSVHFPLHSHGSMLNRRYAPRFCIWVRFRPRGCGSKRSCPRWWCRP